MVKKGMNKGLGKGLDALLAVNDTTDSSDAGIIDLRMMDVEPNPGQPRKHFDPEKLQSLADSIREHGVVQPILVRKEAHRYLIVAGERRWRASKLAGMKTIPAIVREFSAREIMEIALIENLQREDLNPIEEAEAYQRLLNEYEMTQEEVSRVVGKSRSAIANSVRLLALAEPVRQMLVDGLLTSGHARTLLAISTPDKQEEIAIRMIEKGINVREAEQWVAQYLARETQEEAKGKKKALPAPEWREMVDRLCSTIGTKVEVTGDRQKGKIILSYYSSEELERLNEFLMKPS